MFGELVTAYLFLAGVGAGGIAAASLVDLVHVRARCGSRSSQSVAAAPPAERLVAFSFAAAFAALALGVSCLVVDLGRIDRVASLFFSFPLGLMNVGAWSLAALLAVAFALTLMRFMYLPRITRRMADAMEALSLVLAAVVAVYAGVLLGTLTGVRLWSYPCVPVLFVLSAASCGCAAAVAAALFSGRDERVAAVVRAVLAADAAIIAAELLVALLFALQIARSAHPGVGASADRLLQGDMALAWWVGFIVCGLLAPLAMEACMRVRYRIRTQGPVPGAALVSIAFLVLVGGMSLRFAVVGVGEQRPLELQEVASGSSARSVPASHTPDGSTLARESSPMTPGALSSLSITAPIEGGSTVC